MATKKRSTAKGRKTSTSRSRGSSSSRSKSSSSGSRKKSSSSKKKPSGRRYSPGASKDVEREMHEFKRGKLKMGRSGKKVTNPKQAIAIGLSEARREGKRVPPPKKSSRRSSGRKAA
jgi:hypothetical protein